MLRQYRIKTEIEDGHPIYTLECKPPNGEWHTHTYPDGDKIKTCIYGDLSKAKADKARFENKR